MQIKILKVGLLETNCYILTKGNKHLIIDPGDNFNKIIENLENNLVGILLTHRHFDHVGALKKLIDYYKVKVYDISSLKEGANQISNFIFKVIYTPGHTADSISFLFDKNLFSGDFIFKNTIGRTDLGGNKNDMIKSITNILKYPEDITIYPGHGDKTTLKEEKDMLNYYKKNL